MEKTEVAKTNLFSNYLRDIYIEMNPKELEWVKTKCQSISSSSWCAIIPDVRLMKGLLCYFLISRKCPEFRILSTIEITESRFIDEENLIRELIYFDGILILRHSSSFIRNKLMLETMMYVVAERAYKEKRTIVISDVFKDSGEYTYYDHEKVLQHLKDDFSLKLATNKPTNHISSKPASPYASVASSNKPLANMNSSRNLKEQQLRDRTKCIEKGTKDAI